MLSWYSRRFRAMGTDVHLVVHGGPPHLVEWAEAEIARLEGHWSRFLPDSDVTRLNANSGGEPVRVAPETIDVVARACRLWHTTDARFDPTVLRALEHHGYDATFEIVRAREPEWQRVVSEPPGCSPMRFQVARRDDDLDSHPAPGCAGIVIDRAHSTITLPTGCVIDLGGIGKGYAGDLVVRGLLARGASGACIGVGGDVRALGAGPDNGAWPIEVENPFAAGQTLFTIPLRDSAIVTSTRLIRRWRHRGRWRHHIIDPATGRPADTGLAAVIVADRVAWRAEGLAKAALVAGEARGRALLDRHEVTGWFVDDVGRVAA